jgi:hypothetical protein
MNFKKKTLTKSEIYRLAQIAVLRDSNIDCDDTLIILRELMEAESLAEFAESREEGE